MSYGSWEVDVDLPHVVEEKPAVAAGRHKQVGVEGVHRDPVHRLLVQEVVQRLPRLHLVDNHLQKINSINTFLFTKKCPKLFKKRFSQTYGTADKRHHATQITNYQADSSSISGSSISKKLQIWILRFSKLHFQENSNPLRFFYIILMASMFSIWMGVAR